MKTIGKRFSATGILLLVPFLVLALVFIVYPIFRGIWNSFHDFRFGSTLFVGLGNYRKVFTSPLYLTSIRNSLVMVALVTPGLIFLGLVISGSIFDKSQLYMSAIRISLYIPVISSMVVMSIIWRFILDAQTGLARHFFNSIGVRPVNLLGEAKFAMGFLIALLISMRLGQSVVLYVAGMLGISDELIDALKIDGGNRYHLFRYILVPLSSQITLFIFITQSAGLIRIFVPIKLLTNGGPNHATTTMMFLLHRDGFTYGNFGSASALGVVMFLITSTLVIVRLSVMAAQKRRKPQR